MNDQEFARQVPSDRDAERWTLGCAMRYPAAMTEVARMLEPADFVVPGHQQVYGAMVTLDSQNVPLTPVTVKAELEERGEIRAVGRPEYLFELYELAAAMIPSSAMYHARLIREKSARRTVSRVGHRLVQRAGDPATELADLVADAQDEIAGAAMSAADAQGRADDVQGAAAFLSGHHSRPPAVIPGLLDRTDRLMMVGVEGDGKSTYLRQFAVSGAAGLHPFTRDAIPPIRSMIIDLQNPEHLLRREIAVKHVEAAQAHGAWDARRLSFFLAASGVDLTDAAGRMRMLDAIRRAFADGPPDLIVAGPIDKMYRDRGQGAEELHSQVTDFWDVVRERYGSAIMLEHHAPKGNNGGRLLEPKNWGGYMGWPEFGHTMARIPGCKVPTWRLGRFRGDREKGRPWPVKLMHNDAARPCFPWKAIYDDNTFQARLGETG